MQKPRHLNKAELQSLFTFVKSKRLRHFDLQVELVDHLATSIEQQWQAHPQRPLEEALQIEYKKFGIFGFGKLTERKTSELTRRGLRSLHQRLLRWLQLPRLFLVFPALILLSLLFQYSPHDLYIILGIVLAADIIIINAVIQQRRFAKELSKKLLALDVQWQNGLSSINLLMLLLQVLVSTDLLDLSQAYFWIAPFLALLGGYALLFSYELVHHQFPKARREADALLSIYETAEIA